MLLKWNRGVLLFVRVQCSLSTVHLVNSSKTLFKDMNFLFLRQTNKTEFCSRLHQLYLALWPKYLDLRMFLSTYSTGHSKLRPSRNVKTMIISKENNWLCVKCISLVMPVHLVADNINIVIPLWLSSDDRRL